LTTERSDQPDRGPRGMDALLRDAVRAALHDHPAMRAGIADPDFAPDPDRPATRPLGGILYAEDFDAPVAPPPAAPAPEPTHSALELADARELGRAEGWRAARAAAEAQIEAQRAAVLHAIAAALSEARDAAENFAADAAESIARTALSLLAAALPATCARHGERELRALALAVLPALEAEPRIVIRASPLGLRSLAETVARLDPELAARVQLLPAEALSADEARITWQDGRAVRDRRAVQAAIEAVLAPLGLFEPVAQTVAHTPAPTTTGIRAELHASPDPTTPVPKEMADAR
jgi:hypothetical protein